MQISCDCDNLFGKLITMKFKECNFTAASLDPNQSERGDAVCVCNKPDADTKQATDWR